MPAGKALLKVVYKPSPTTHEEFFVIVNPEEYQRWKAGETSIPLTEVVDSFQVFHSTQGSQGLLGQPSKQQLDNVFGTHKDIDVVEQILKLGKPESGEGIHSGAGGTNLAHGSFTIDTRGKDLSGIDGKR